MEAVDTTITDLQNAADVMDLAGRDIQGQKQKSIKPRVKIVAKIANDKRPDGWEEEFLAPGLQDKEEGVRVVEKIVEAFNKDLRGDIPRRILSTTFVEMTRDECFGAGKKAYPEEDCPLSENRREQHDAWWDGWREAESEDQEGEEE